MTLLGIVFFVLILGILGFTFFSRPTVVETPVFVNRYIQEPVPIYVQPAWWGSFGAPWGYKTGYTKHWKIGSGLPGMKVEPSQPAPPPSQPAPTPPPSQPAPPPSTEPSQPAPTPSAT